MTKAPYRKRAINIDDVFNNLTVIAESSRTSGGHEVFLCKCVCGAEKLIRKSNLGVVIGCGCVRKKYAPKTVKPSVIIENGAVYHDWTVIEPSTQKDLKGEAYYLCECACGNKRDVRKSSLGKVQGCGCARKKNGEITLTRTRVERPVKRPIKETKKEKAVRQSKVVATLESLTGSAGGNNDLEPIYHVPPTRKTAKGDARAKLDDLLAERELARELAALDYDY